MHPISAYNPRTDSSGKIKLTKDGSVLLKEMVCTCMQHVNIRKADSWAANPEPDCCMIRSPKTLLKI